MGNKPLRNSVIFHFHIICSAWVLCGILFAACNSSVDEEGMVKYLQKPSSGLQKVQDVADVKAVATYRPSALLAAQECSGNSQIDICRDSMMQQLASTIIFN